MSNVLKKSLEHFQRNRSKIESFKVEPPPPLPLINSAAHFNEFELQAPGPWAGRCGQDRLRAECHSSRGRQGRIRAGPRCVFWPLSSANPRPKHMTPESFQGREACQSPSEPSLLWPRKKA